MKPGISASRGAALGAALLGLACGGGEPGTAAVALVEVFLDRFLRRR